MTRWIVVMVAAAGLIGNRPAYGQDGVPGAGAVVVTLIPAGAMFVAEEADIQEPSFSNYALGTGVEVHFNRYVGVEGEVIGALGFEQDLQFSGDTLKLKPPHLLTYNGNLVLSVANRSSLVPYVAVGIGGLTMFDKADLGINETETFLMGDVGGGVEWFRGRWGLRGDYRFIAVQSKDDAQAPPGASPSAEFLRGRDAVQPPCVRRASDHFGALSVEQRDHQPQGVRND